MAVVLLVVALAVVAVVFLARPDLRRALLHWLDRVRGRPDTARDIRWLNRARGGAPNVPPRPPPAPPGSAEPPTAADFRIEIRAGAVMPTSRQQALSVDHRGAAQSEYARRAGHPRPVRHTFLLADAELRHLGDVLRSSGFFDAQGADPGWIDGDYLEVRATVDGRENAVTLVNAFDEDVAAVVRAVNAAVPETMRVIYSQLRGPAPDAGGLI